jgi:hypothetical protein
MENTIRNSIAKLFGALLVLVSLIGGVLLGKRRFERTVDGHVDELLSDVECDTDQQYTPEKLADLPTPVRAYFTEVLTEGQSTIRTIRLHQHGEFRLGDADAPWRTLTATQYFTTQPPGFVWNATIDVLPWLPVRVIDLYKRGNGILRARLLGAVPVASAGPNRDLNEGELVRYLAEAVWFPTALLPSQGVMWEAIDDRSARATLEHEGVTASLVFHFDDRNRITHATTDRYRQEDDAYAPWTGYFRDYEDRDGILVPTKAEVEWNLTDGDLPYWRATIDAITYRTMASPQ